MILNIFISKLPNEPKLILQSRNPYSMLNAKEILIDTDHFYVNKTQTSQFLQPNSFSRNCDNNHRDKNRFNS